MTVRLGVEGAMFLGMPPHVFLWPFSMGSVLGTASAATRNAASYDRLSSQGSTTKTAPLSQL